MSNVVELIHIPKVWAAQVAVVLRATHEEAKRARKQQMAGYTAQLAALDGREDKLYEDFQAVILTEEKYKRDIKNLCQLREELTDLLRHHQGELNDAYIDTIETIFELASEAKSLLNQRSDEEKVVFLEKFISNSRLRGLSVEYDLRSPFEVIAKMRASGDWRPQARQF